VTRKIVVPQPISEAIGTFELPRPILVRLLARMHHDIWRDYERFKRFRLQGDRLYRYRFVIEDEHAKHLFTFVIDDTTAQEHLIVADIRHDVK
jgi:hypothetical protein